MAQVRVGIVSWNTADLLDRCLAMLPAALEGVDAEVVVVDNASGDGSAAVAAGHPGVTVIANDANVGYARAMNQALGGTDAPWLIALNPDTEAPAGSLATLVADLESHDDVGLVVPRLVGADGAHQHSVYRFPTVTVAAVVSFVPPRLQRGRIGQRWWLEASRAAALQPSGPIDWAIGAVHVIRRAALSGDRPYSERWFMYVEDIELCWRLHERGWGVRLDADVAIPHVGNTAGAQAWGDTRSTRYWAASYDFTALSRGGLYARALAAVNVAGVALHISTLSLGAAVGRRGSEGRRAAAAQLRSVLPVHLDILRRGARRPDAEGHIRLGDP